MTIVVYHDDGTKEIYDNVCYIANKGYITQIMTYKSGMTWDGPFHKHFAKRELKAIIKTFFKEMRENNTITEVEGEPR